jgi:hypothetical protein
MGAVSFSLDIRLVEQLKKVLPLDVFVETGTFKGDTIQSVLPFFRKLVTVELSPQLWKDAAARFAGESRVEVLLGSSPEFLSAVDHDASVLFWLDAHWCIAENTSGEHSQCPLLDEIRAIGRLAEHSVLLIDDARLFLAPPPEPHDVAQWPTFEQIDRALRELSSRHELMIVNDIIAFFPASVRESVIAYARRCGVDWLKIVQNGQSVEECFFNIRRVFNENQQINETLRAINGISMPQLLEACDQTRKAAEKLLSQNSRRPFRRLSESIRSLKRRFRPK